MSAATPNHEAASSRKPWWYTLGYLFLGIGTGTLLFVAYHTFFAHVPNVMRKASIEMRVAFGMVEILIGLCFLRWKTKSPSSRDAPSQANELRTNTRLAPRRENQEEGDD